MSKFKLKHSYYKASTPELFRKIGDSILIAGPILQTAIMELPITENAKIWINFGITILTVIGKIVTNFFVESHPTDQVDPTIPQN